MAKYLFKMLDHRQVQLARLPLLGINQKSINKQQWTSKSTVFYKMDTKVDLVNL